MATSVVVATGVAAISVASDGAAACIAGTAAGFG
jgi:hypothetical protein